MNDVVTLLLEVLGRTTLWLAVVALLTGVVLRVARPNWPLAHRAAWLLVLLVGWTFLRFPLELPWYEARWVVPSLIAAQAPLGEQAPAEPDEIIELKPAPAATTVAAELVAASEVGAPVNGRNALGSEVRLPREASPGSTPWKDRAAAALVGVWLLGIVVLLAAWLVGYVRFLRLLGSRVAADDRWASEWQALLAASGVRRQIPLSMADDLGPLLCHLPSGYELVVSEPLWRELDVQERRAILRHELAHYQRGDVWKSMAARFLALPHWFNPASWWAVNRFDEAAEWACDRAAVGEGEMTAYAKVLMRLGQVVSHDRVYGSAARGRTLATRIRRMLTARTTADSTLKKALLVGVALFLAAASVVQIELVAQQPADGSSAKIAEHGDRDKNAVPKNEKVATKEPTVELVPEAKNVADVAANEQPVETAGTEDESDENRVAARQLVEHAHKTYEASLAAYLAETAPLESVYEWSWRWMEAARDATTDRAQRISLAKEHLARMQELQKKIRALNQVGSKGGDEQKLKMVGFYVTQAEQALTLALHKGAFKTEERESAAVQRESVIDYEMQIIDVRIKISQLKDQFEKTKIDYAVAAKTAARVANQAAKGVVTLTELARMQGESQKAKIELEGLKEQLKLHENKLALLNARARSNADKSGKQVPIVVGIPRTMQEGTVVFEARTEAEPAVGPSVATVSRLPAGTAPQSTKRKVR